MRSNLPSCVACPALRKVSASAVAQARMRTHEARASCLCTAAAVALRLDQDSLAPSRKGQRSPLRPNPSLEPTRSGKAHWPPRAQYHVALVGQWALPPRSAQLKR